MTAPNIAPGSVVNGKFTVRMMLGYGGASATFRAVSPQGGEVALRVLSPAIGQRQDAMGELQRYVAETNALPPDRAAHIIDAGYDQATAAPYTVTELIQAPSLAQMIMRRPLSADEVGAVLQTLAGLLDAAHARELFHSGIKPTNIFVDPNAPAQLKVTDFGGSFARALVPTQEGYVVAAPWMAPEQMQAGAPVGAAADVFAAALVAFFSLTGRSYWRSCQGSADLPSWQREIMSPRTAASVRGVELGVQLNPALDPVFARALALDPRERFHSMGELAAAFRGMPVSRLEAAQTLALPSSGYDAPPPHAPLPPQHQGYAPADPGAGGYPPVAEPYRPQQPAPDTAHAYSTHTQVPPPTIASLGGVPRTTSGKLAPIVVGGVAVLLLGGAAAAFLVLGGESEGGSTPTTADSATAATAATGEPDPTQPEPAGSAALDAPPPGEPPDAGIEETGPAEVAVKVTCSPEACQEILINDKPIADPGAEVQLLPGKHKVTVKLAGFIPKTETIVVEAGQPLQKDFVLVQVPRNTGAPAPAPAAPCGKFLKRCK